eukprot:gnl/MRDRNA2_/MRDRNA2_337860_c0_seq1.p1 gnl/MRDRNA2_/MRDRNA2_337860_c0~~gnl/MRDRNA2_/MRDRNA2_337860_c0_seq1.p1  ORF type:complete len:126 (+),score=8.72 gnl/MRDRNA2_/MRDRNA2_337860_c0_seq1:3-380(+)
MAASVATFLRFVATAVAGTFLASFRRSTWINTSSTASCNRLRESNFISNSFDNALKKGPASRLGLRTLANTTKVLLPDNAVNVSSRVFHESCKSTFAASTKSGFRLIPSATTGSGLPQNNFSTWH